MQRNKEWLDVKLSESNTMTKVMWINNTNKGFSCGFASQL